MKESKMQTHAVSFALPESFKTERCRYLVKRYRALAGLSSDEVARQMGWSSGEFVQQVEDGDQQLPLEDWLGLVNLLNIPVEEMMEAIDNDLYLLEVDEFG